MFDLSASIARMEAASARAANAFRLDRIIARQRAEMEMEREREEIHQQYDEDHGQ